MNISQLVFEELEQELLRVLEQDRVLPMEFSIHLESESMRWLAPLFSRIGTGARLGADTQSFVLKLFGYDVTFVVDWLRPPPYMKGGRCCFPAVGLH